MTQPLEIQLHQRVTRLTRARARGFCTGIKEYSDWPTIPQLYVDNEFIGGCDILINMHKDGSLADLLADKNVLVLEEGEGDIEGERAEAVRRASDQSTGGRSKDAKGESS